MNILFMSLGDFDTINTLGLYTGLLREFVKHGDEVYILSPVEKHKQWDHKSVIKETHATIIKFKIGNIQKTKNIIKKGLATVCVTGQFITALKKHLAAVKFDLVLYPTPPITLLGVVEYVKKRDNAKTYLILKDIFPQNAVDIGLMAKTGLKGLVYRYFRKQEKKFYVVSDYIGCLSQANVDYLLKHNPEINSNKVEVCPNTADLVDYSCDKEQALVLRKKYGIPLDKKVFVYGGNLGQPQGIPFLIECLRLLVKNYVAYFLIIGSGTHFDMIQKFIDEEKPANVKLMQRIPKDDYDQMIGSCDVGLIFLDHRFTIPNFPSRLLSYMQAQIPILAVTDPNTDVGKVIVEGDFGWWCESNDAKKVAETVEKIANGQLTCDGKNGFKYLQEHYTHEIAYKIIRSKIEKGNLVSSL